jgi:hypothetical protein
MPKNILLCKWNLLEDWFPEKFLLINLIIFVNPSMIIWIPCYLDDICSAWSNKQHWKSSFLSPIVRDGERRLSGSRSLSSKFKGRLLLLLFVICQYILYIHMFICSYVQEMTGKGLIGKKKALRNYPTRLGYLFSRRVKMGKLYQLGLYCIERILFRAHFKFPILHHIKS